MILPWKPEELFGWLASQRLLVGHRVRLELLINMLLPEIRYLICADFEQETRAAAMLCKGFHRIEIETDRVRDVTKWINHRRELRGLPAGSWEFTMFKTLYNDEKVDP